MSDEEVIYILKGIEEWNCIQTCDWVKDGTHDCNNCRERKAFALAIQAIKQTEECTECKKKEN